MNGYEMGIMIGNFLAFVWLGFRIGRVEIRMRNFESGKVFEKVAERFFRGPN